ncbi:YraN family protein [Candidatus Francisella endociliophora]|uniref:YraN family protein n=1 Tax=Candidatus Francisella endociliophora TaxID=653937 RepID=UPI001F325B2C|nr:YraN family protein [Francisella sp. FSC1006]
MKILFQSFKALPYGEIDIIVLDKDILIFVEVKYRRKTNFAKAEKMFKYSKQQKLINTTNIFLQQNLKYEGHESRFDLVAINKDDINWIKNASQVI